MHLVPIHGSDQSIFAIELVCVWKQLLYSAEVLRRGHALAEHSEYQRPPPAAPVSPDIAISHRTQVIN